MAEVYPFIGTRYNSQLIGNLSKVISPPYDAITPALQAALHERHEHNIVRLEAAFTEDAHDEDSISRGYSRVANTLGTWRSDGIFIEDERPSFYFYEQVSKGVDGAPVSRAGFFAKVKLEEKSIVDADNAVAFTGARADRLDLIRFTKANISAVTGVCADANDDLLSVLKTRMHEKPWEEMKDDAGVIHRLWVVQKKDILLKLVELMKTRQIFVADGHQRYLVAQVYRDEMRATSGKADGKQPFDFMMMLVLPGQQEGLKAEPMHRVLTRSIMADVDLKGSLEELADQFEIIKEKIDLAGGEAEAQRINTKLQELGASTTALCMVHASGTAWYLVMKADCDIADLYDGFEMPQCIGTLDVCVLHTYVINQVMIGNPEYELEDDECLYLSSTASVLDVLQSKKGVCAFLLNPISINNMLNIACQGALVPHEAGVLSPRPATGLVIRNMQTDIIKTVRK